MLLIIPQIFAMDPDVSKFMIITTTKDSPALLAYSVTCDCVSISSFVSYFSCAGSSMAAMTKSLFHPGSKSLK